MWKRALVVLLLSGISLPVCAGQAPANQQTPTIKITTREVILDLIVRDKHHRAITDLRPDEIEVLEDGVKQRLSAFRNVQGVEQLQTEQAVANSNTPTSPGAAPQTPSTTLHEVNFVSVVFAQITPLNLEFAREAVLEFLKSGSLPNTYVTVYRLDRSLKLVQPYTAEKTRLVSAVNAAAKGVNSGGGLGTSAIVASGIDSSITAAGENIIASPLSTSQQVLEAEGLMLNPAPGIATDPTWARNASSEDASITLSNALVTQARLETGLRFSESLSNGMDAWDALRELVRVEAKLPGRKVVLYLADGLTLPMDRRDVVDSVISYANQMEVAFYAVDTRGLSTENPLAQPLADLQRVGAESSVNRIDPRMGKREDDDEQLAATSDKELAMKELAESTGGFAVTNTNEIALPMQRVMEDIRTHYEVAYKPSATNYDGHFRKIQVRVSRPHVTVQTRSGYFALPEFNGEPLQPFEMTALHAINARPAAEEFPYQAALLRFRPKAAAVDHEMTFDVPVSSLQVVVNPKTGDGKIRVSMLALIQKSDGEVVGKVSRSVERTISKSQLGQLGEDHVLYAEPIQLPGGHYRIDTAVTDDLAQKTTVKRISVFVAAGKDFGVSSLELVRRVQPMPGPHDRQDPFEIEAGRIVPTLTESVPSGKPISVYFVVYPTAGVHGDPTVTLEVYRDGREVGIQKLPASQPKADGSIPMLLRINPDPGQCDMIVTAHQGTMTSESSLSVKITPGETANPN